MDPNATFNDDTNPTYGSTDAKVTVRIFSDFQCPACKVAEGPLREIREQYKDRVRFVWNDFPLKQIHPNAYSAAVAARCAQEQNKFWEYSQSLFNDQTNRGALPSPDARYVELAKGLDLQTDSFSNCLQRTQPQDKVDQDVAEGDALLIDSTPTFFVNREMLSGSMTVAQWQQKLDEALR